MTYVKTNWVDNVTDVDATNMNHIEDGIKDNETSIGAVDTKVDYNDNILTSFLGNKDNTWESGGTYAVDDRVFYNKKLYYNLTGTNTALTPDLDSTNWAEMTLFAIDGYFGYDFIGGIASPVNTHSTSTTDVYSANQTNVEIANAVKDVYSTSEVKTNEVWIDNKPIYKKTIDLTSGWNIGSEIQLSHNIANVDNMLKYEGTAYRTDGQNQMIPSNFGSNNYVLSVFDISSTKYRLYVGSSFSGSNALTHIYITFYYTKTTD